MAQLLRPVADVSNTGWLRGDGAGTSLYAAIDETTATDTDFVRSDQASSPASVIFQIEVAGDPGSNASHILRYRYRKDSSSGDTVDLDVILQAGDWDVHTAAHDAIAQTITATSFTLTSAEVDEFRAKGGYSNSRVKLVRRKRATITTSTGVTYVSSPVALTCNIRRPASGGPYPVVILLVDGLFQSNDLTQADPSAIRLSQEEGFATMVLGLRVAPTYIAPAPMEDCADAIDFIVANAGTYNFDANNIAFIGGSGGGNVAIYGALGTHLTAGQFARVKCAASMSSPNAFRYMDDDGASGPYTSALEAYLGVTEAASPSTWDDHSPINDVTASAKPIFQAYSTAESIPVNQGTRLKTPLDSASVPNRMLTYSGTLHGWDLIESAQPWAELVTWLHRYLG